MGEAECSPVAAMGATKGALVRGVVNLGTLYTTGIVIGSPVASGSAGIASWSMSREFCTGEAEGFPVAVMGSDNGFSLSSMGPGVTDLAGTVAAVDDTVSL